MEKKQSLIMTVGAVVLIIVVVLVSHAAECALYYSGPCVAWNR